MRLLPTTRRLALTGALAAVAIAAAPALASAASTCSYNTSNKNLIVNDHSGTTPLRILHTTAGEIHIRDGSTGPSGIACPIPNGPNATVFNTSRIAVFATAADATGQNGDGYIIDESNGPFGPSATPDNDGNNEVKIQIDTSHARPNSLDVIGTQGDDEIRVGQTPTLPVAINLGFASTPLSDQDVDVSMTDQPEFVYIEGRGGDDFLSGHGNEANQSTQPYTGNLDLFGGPGNDFLIAGNDGTFLRGGLGDDRYFGVNGVLDFISEFADEGNDVATIDQQDDVLNGNVEQINIQSAVGHLQLTPAAVTTRAGEAAHVKLAWTDPNGWKQLRSLALRARAADGTIAGTVTVDRAHERLSSLGALSVLRSSKVGHHGKTVTADLTLAANSLAGRTLRLEVQATDVHGHTQLEPLAGTLTVTK